MYSLTYVSAAVVLFSKEELRDLLVICEKNNRRDAISGLLLYKDGNFMQALEGEEAAVRRTHARSAADPRHGGLITLLQGPQEGRLFPDWSMGFRELGAASSKPAGYNEFLNSPLTGNEFSANPGRAQRLLMTFKAR